MQGLSRRDFLRTTAAVGVGAAAGLGLPGITRAQAGTVKVGVLHSLSGTMAISEVSLRDVCMMAFDEINAKGGVMGKKIEPVVVDPASNWDLFAEKAKQLLLQDKVAVTFGCWTSVSRKSVLPVFENNNGLLFYPVQYEGEECSKNVFYTGATPNQQLIPAAEYLMSKEGGGYKKFYLLGTDYVFPRTANKILRAFLLAKGIPAESHRRGIHAVQPSGLPDDRRQDQALLDRRQRGGAVDHQRRQQRAVLQGIRQPGPAQRERADHGVQRGRGRAARHGHGGARRSSRRVELLSSRWTRHRTRSSSRRSRPTRRRATSRVATSA